MDKAQVKTAQLNDLSLVRKLLTDTAKWLREKGSTQWAGLLKGEDVHNIEEAIKRKEVFLVYRSQKIIGTFALWSTQTKWDQELWGENESNDFLYLHRLALGNNEHGRNAGSILLDKAKEITISKDKKGLRLDCLADNTYLNTFYKKNDFSFQKGVKGYFNGIDHKDYHLYYWENRKKVLKNEI
ncbi:GNAT family N-acetyltransferase [Alkalibacterium kapii]|uniref:Putative N-acetyltransferase YesJ n=1 Tax=Alkalibacterium kapii TaxID=426704 RepID=A0A511AVK7_9LACT|nr:GNAT family N-acetyltransferase [Alkalibacterium kapii]GEK92230.1 putative N-acetyltransferase YesJ [Alkalibacterium kapii]